MIYPKVHTVIGKSEDFNEILGMVKGAQTDGKLTKVGDHYHMASHHFYVVVCGVEEKAAIFVHVQEL